MNKKEIPEYLKDDLENLNTFQALELVDSEKEKNLIAVQIEKEKTINILLKQKDEIKSGLKVHKIKGYNFFYILRKKIQSWFN